MNEMQECSEVAAEEVNCVLSRKRKRRKKKEKKDKGKKKRMNQQRRETRWKGKD